MQKRFRGKSFGLKNWDYGSNGSYFITICTEDKTSYFGDVVGGEMNHSVSGKMAEYYWNEIPVKFPYAKIDSFVVMPNHVHGIITVDKPTNSYIDFVGANLVENLRIAQTNFRHGGFGGIKNPMLHDNISRIIRWYKGRCTFEIHKIDKKFGWQSLFHDKIIRTKESYNRIVRYIKNNPANWERDKMFNG